MTQTGRTFKIGNKDGIPIVDRLYACRISSREFFLNDIALIGAADGANCCELPNGAAKVSCMWSNYAMTESMISINVTRDVKFLLGKKIISSLVSKSI